MINIFYPLKDEPFFCEIIFFFSDIFADMTQLSIWSFLLSCVVQTAMITIILYLFCPSGLNVVMTHHH